MIRKLMASTALVALIGMGAVSPTWAQDAATAPAPDTTQAQDTASQTSDQDKLVPEQPTVASAFMGRSVYSSNDPESETIGKVNDLIINNDGSITDAVVGVGGFLGIGEKNVAVPFKELQVVERDGEIRLIYAATREQLEAAPDIDLASYDPAARYSEQQAAMNPAGTDVGLGAAPGAVGTAPAPADTMAAAPVEPAPAGEAAAPDDTAAAPATPAEPAGQMAATDQPGAGDAFRTYSPEQVRASTMIGQSVYGPDDQTIGEVNDLVLQEDGKTRSALIDVGGFLGVGEKTVAIPFTDIQVQQEQNTDNLHLTVAMTKDQLEQLPAYQQPDRLAATTPPAGEQPANGAATGNNMAATEGTNAAGDQSTGQMAAAPAEGSDNVVTGSLPQEGYQLATQDLPASELIGATVYGQGDESIGEINDVVFNKDGQIDAVVLDVGGFLGIGEKPVAVGFDQLNVRTDDGGNLLVMINAPKEQLENAPTYQESAQAQ